MRPRRISIFFLLAVVLLLTAGRIFASSLADQLEACKEISDNTDQQKCYEDVSNSADNKIKSLQEKESTLTNEIAYIDSEIQIAEYKIQVSMAKITATENQIAKLSANITDLAGRIDKLSVSMDYQKKVLGSRMRERYETGEGNILDLFGSDSFRSLIEKTEYLKVMELYDNKLLAEMKATKDDFNTQKQLFEDSKAKQESLRQQLIAEKANLDANRSVLDDKRRQEQKLLEDTQNNEAKFEQIKADVLQELAQIVGAVSVLKNAKGIKVKAGEAIGIQGSTGHSTGPHLHFGVYKYSSFKDIDGWNWYYSNEVDPTKMLSSKKVYWSTGCETPGYRTVGSGKWVWPEANPQVTQGFGHTCWSSIYYGGKEHPAIDMAGPANSIIFAVADGTAYSCRNCLGDGGNGMFVFHSNGYMTVYWHMQ